MRLREIKRDCPERFTYRNKDFYMSYYSMGATHKGQRSDNIIWESEDKTICINYEKGYIYAVNENNEVFSEVEDE